MYTNEFSLHVLKAITWRFTSLNPQQPIEKRKLKLWFIISCSMQVVRRQYE